VADGVVEFQLVVLFEKQDGHCGELFCQRSHSEVGGAVDGGGQVGKAGGVLVEDIAVFLDGKGDAGLVSGEGVEEGVEAGSELGLGERGGRDPKQEGEKGY